MPDPEAAPTPPRGLPSAVDAGASRPRTGSWRDARLLVVEDDRELRRFLAKAFREEGYVVVDAESDDRALERARGGDYGCIVLDVVLPRGDGVHMVRELRACNVTTPILMLTAHDGLEARLRGLEAGADDCLAKPFDLREMLARIRALIRRANLPRRDATLSAGELVLDRLTRRVTHAGRPVDLTPREFTLLEFLMRNAGRTVSRSVIASVVWRYQFDSGTNVIDVYVNYLRKKLGGDRRAVTIRSVRGVGYRLDANDA
jgi:two-component system OmpR family response regulator